LVLKKDTILTIVGPTAVGKTELAMEIARAISGEIISVDSRQVYKYLDIGTAKPTPAQQKRVKFHLIDIISPDDNYSCGQFVRDAEAIIDELKKRNKIPIVCGGTGLYIKSLFNPLHPLPQSNPEIKKRLMNLLKNHGLPFLYDMLTRIDPAWAKRITPKDRQRILRGLEVYEMTGEPLSNLIKRKKREAKYQAYLIGLNLPRPRLYQKIASRFDNMIKRGLVAETRSLLDRGFNPNSNALRTLGYK